MKKLIIVLIALSMGLVTYTNAQETQKKDTNKHPMVSQVDHRIHNQKKLVSKEEEAGKITTDQADQYRKDLSSIKHEKKVMSKSDNGKITKKDQKELNKELDIIHQDVKN